MSWKDIVCLLTVVIGVVLFLYGANYYDEAVGWTGVLLMVLGLVFYFVFKLHEVLGKRSG